MMMRKLTAREKFLMVVLAVLLASGLYYTLFYTPIMNKTIDADNAVADVQNEITISQAKLQKMGQMQREIKSIFAKAPNPTALAKYDNSGALMEELNTTLSAASSYNLTFAAVDTSSEIISRNINLSFTAGSYRAARNILEQLQNGQYRCLIRDLSISMGGGTPLEGGGYSQNVTVTAQLTYYEYKD